MEIIKSHCIKLISILKGSGGALLRIVWENIEEDKFLSSDMEVIYKNEKILKIDEYLVEIFKQIENKATLVFKGKDKFDLT